MLNFKKTETVYFRFQGFEMEGEVVRRTQNYVELKTPHWAHNFRCTPAEVSNKKSSDGKSLRGRIRSWQRALA